MLAGRAAKQQAAGHAQMNHEISAAAQAHYDELAIALDTRDLAALDALRHHVGSAAAQHTQAPELGGHNAAAYQRRDGPHDRFDFGKFGHLRNL